MPSKHSPRSNGRRATTCRECKRHEDEAGPMSARDLCRDCRIDRQTSSNEQIRAGAGPHFDEYVRGLRSYVDRLPA